MSSPACVAYPPPRASASSIRRRATSSRPASKAGSNPSDCSTSLGPDAIYRGPSIVSLLRRCSERWALRGSSGYWRLPSRPPQPNASVDGAVDTGLSDDLPSALEEVTRLGLKKLARAAGASGYNGWQPSEVAGDGGDWCDQCATQSRRATAETEGTGRRSRAAAEDRGGGTQETSRKNLFGSPSC